MSSYNHNLTITDHVAYEKASNCGAANYHWEAVRAKAERLRL